MPWKVIFVGPLFTGSEVPHSRGGSTGSEKFCNNSLVKSIFVLWPPDFVMIISATFSNACDRWLRSNQRLFCAAILTTAACLAVQGRKGQPNGSLKIVHLEYRAWTSIRYDEKYDRYTFVARYMYLGCTAVLVYGHMWLANCDLSPCQTSTLTQAFRALSFSTAVGRVLNAYLNDCKWCYTCDAILIIANCQMRKLHVGWAINRIPYYSSDSCACGRLRTGFKNRRKLILNDRQLYVHACK